MKLRAVLFDQTGGLKFGQRADFIKYLAVVRKQRLTDMKSREMLLLQKQNAPAGFGQIAGRGAPARPAADDQRIVFRLHTGIKQNFRAANKAGGQNWSAPPGL